MINTKKIINPSLKTSNNILEDLSSPLSKRIGFIKGHSPVIPIFFYRYVGMLNNENEYYEEIRGLDEKLSNLGNSYLKFTKSIPITRNDKIISKTQDVWQKKSSFNYSNKDCLIDDLIKANVLSIPNNKLISSSMEESFDFIVNLYMTKEQGVNLTKIKNFSLKLLTWIDSFIPTLYRDVDYTSESNEMYNPKVLFYGDIKKHEAYFLIFLSRLGCDILYVNPNSDGAFQSLDPKEQFSKFHRLPQTGVVRDPNDLFKAKQKKTTSPPPKFPKDMGDSLSLNVINSQNIITVSLKNSNDPLKDVFEPLDKRPGFVGLPLPLVPTYFCRYIGINGDEDKYYNRLFKLNEGLQNFHDLYIRFNKNIPLNTKNDLLINTQMVWKDIGEFDISKRDLLISLLIKANVFPKLNNNLLDSTFVNAFTLIIELFLKTERDINLSKIRNFSLKILTWSHHFIPKLIKSFDFQRKSDSTVYNPKILYYGDIKKHGVLFLILLSKLGCDILYVNSSNDEAFLKHQDLQIYSKLVEFPNKRPLREFPSEEVLLREETTAFKASREISTIIHNEEDGVYKPWQFESYKTHPITLQTTFDELKILWNEDARIRGGFKVENGTVYIPNLFAKISGIHHDLNIYWNEVKHFKSTENTLFISNIPFSKTTFKQSDLYTCAYLINKEGLIDKSSLLQSNVYKFSYLKTPLQDTIIEKINQLFKISPFKEPVDKEFKLKILMTILSIDKEILELIQRFDYPAKVPKLIIYDKDENLFNDEDSIILGFLNLMGFDILILTPPGYNNIEQKINEKYYDIHKLETVKFDLELPNFNSIIGTKKEGSRSFWAGLFSGR